MSAADRTAERAYRLLLRAYPRPFRAEYEREMVTLFRDLRRERRAGAAGFWAAMVWDVARSAPEERLRQLHAPGGDTLDTRPMGGAMRTMAILAVLVGTLEAGNAAAEAWAGRGAGGAPWLAGVALAMVAGGMLLAAGVAMLWRGRRASSWAQAAAVACLAVVLLVRVMHPWMSGFGMLLGVVFPVALLIVLRRGAAPPSAA